ncbi:MAG: hypothetical protein AB1757_09275 [Acidobacteriota bacterium]
MTGDSHIRPVALYQPFAIKALSDKDAETCGRSGLDGKQYANPMVTAFAQIR